MEDGEAATDDLQARVQRQVRRWAVELIDLSEHNTALNQDAAAGSLLRIVGPDVAGVVELVRKPRPVGFFPPPSTSASEAAGWTVAGARDAAGDAELVTDCLDASGLGHTLHDLARRAESDMLDRGVQSLHLCFGTLSWTDPHGQPTRSPLLLLPVQLERPSADDPYVLVRLADEARLNPALRVFLAERCGIDLPEADVDLDGEASLDTAFEEISACVGERGGTVEPSVVLQRATFHKEAMYADLMATAEQIASHPLIADLAFGGLPPGHVQVVRPDPQVPAEEDIDEAAPPESVRFVLSADASQRRAVAAVTGGSSVVIDGPPGTGKSQTVANLAAELIAAGQTVLVVSEKPAALEVVANRLRGRGLEDFLLQLHSEHTSRKDVAEQLGRALRSAPQTGQPPPGTDVERARQLRQQLTAYAADHNRVRWPLGRSVHWVVGRLAQLQAADPIAPPAVPLDMSAADVAGLLEEFGRLARRWRPVEEPEEFIWRDLRADGPSPDRLRHVAAELAKALSEAILEAGRLAVDCRLPVPERLAEAEQLVSTALHTRQQPSTPAAWWARDDVAGMLADVEELHGHQQRYAAAAQALEARYEDGGASLDPASASTLTAACADLASLSPQLELPADPTVGELEPVEETLAALAESARETASTQQRVAEALGAPARPRTPSETLDLAAVAAGADRTHRPEGGWTTQIMAQRAAHALEVLEPLQREYERHRQALDDVFDERVLELDLRGLIQRFDRVHTGLRRLSAGFRADRRAIAEVSRTGRATGDVIARLPDALAWQEAAARLDDAEQRHGYALFRYYQPRDSDVTGARIALDRLEDARRRLGREFDPQGVASQLAGESPEDTELGLRAQRLRNGVAQIRSLAETTEALEAMSLEEIADWASTAKDRCLRLLGVLSAMDRRRHEPVTVSAAEAELARRREMREVEAAIEKARVGHAARLGEAYAGVDTDVSSLRVGLSWVTELHVRYGGPLPQAAIARLHGRGPGWSPEPLQRALERARHHADVLRRAFADQRGQEVADTLTGLLGPAHRLATQLADRGGQIEEWAAHLRSVEELHARGWRHQVQECIARGVPAQRLAATLERALWTGWVDSLARSEPDIMAPGADDLDARVAEFTTLDRALQDDAPQRVLAARHGGDVLSLPAARLIEREAHKKRGHLPIRQLLADTAPAATTLKPVFLMSPLTVSQFLPADLRFDVVVFDEASQIAPADAVSAISRGDRLVVSGDDRQLPPSAHAGLGSAEPDGGDYRESELREFDSLTKLCKSSTGMPTVPLRWHYRSQHETLIAFSHERYYVPEERRLHIFPTAEPCRADRGIRLLAVDGTYRSGPDDNPAEADRVAERVEALAREALAAASSKRPTVGVVALTHGQAVAIEERVDRLRCRRPDLEPFFSTSRLSGFFVKTPDAVQGDERDIIVLSVGYGADEHGRLPAAFEALAGETGRRRLNVAVTRARRRVEVVASIAPDDLDAADAMSPGTADLKAYLEHAGRGDATWHAGLAGAEEDVDAPLEQSVLDCVRGWGYDAVPYTGMGTHRIDVAVLDPRQPDLFVLGIQCDGPAYAGMRAARDRDRLRDEVLAGLGWRLCRVWGPAWYRDRRRQEQRLRRSLDEALGRMDAGGAAAPQ